MDATAFDRWTIIHTAAGVAFGCWYIPLIFVLIVVFLWECFEFSVTGFGDQETILNKFTDMGVAVAGWLVVVVALMVLSHLPFPLASPVPSASGQNQTVSPIHHSSAPRQRQRNRRAEQSGVCIL